MVSLGGSFFTKDGIVTDESLLKKQIYEELKAYVTTGLSKKVSGLLEVLRIHPHAFRHTAASTMIANGVDLVTTAAELGHANANTTATIYAHQIAIARATAADVRAGVFAGRK